MTEPMPDPPGLPSWHVLADQIATETTLLPGAAGLAQVHVIPYQIDTGPAKGLVRKVRVAPSDFVPASVREAIIEDLATVHSVSQLGPAGA
jgi:hypothetical protein